MKTKLATSMLIILIFAASACRQADSTGAAGEAAEEVGSAELGAAERTESEEDDGEMPATVTLSAQEMDFLNLTFSPVSRGAIEGLMTRDGIISVHQDKVARVGPVIPGRVSEMLVGMGDWVEAGRPMARLVSAEVGRALSDFYTAMAELELARVNHERYQRLISQEIGARRDLLAAEAALVIARANVSAAESTLYALGFIGEDVGELRASQRTSSEFMLRAPIAGRVVGRNVTIGERVGEDSTLFTIMDLRSVYIDAQVFEEDIHRVRLGQRVEVSVAALPGRRFEGSVIYLSQRLNPETRTLTVRTEIANPNEELREGLFAQVHIFMGSGGETLCVPTDAVVDDRDLSYVFVPSGDGFRAIQVTTGERNRDWTEVLTGLREGSRVVTEGNYELYSKFRRRARHQRRGRHAGASSR